MHELEISKGFVFREWCKIGGNLKKQISKGIADMSIGRTYKQEKLIGVNQWLTSSQLNTTQLIKV